MLVVEDGIVPVKQIRFSEAEFAAKRGVTRRERFFADMERRGGPVCLDRKPALISGALPVVNGGQEVPIVGCEA